MKLEAKTELESCSRFQVQPLEGEACDFWVLADEPLRHASNPALIASTWVMLRQRPTPFSSDEALLLCPCSEDEWVAWVPDYGEITVSIHELV